MRWLVFWVLLWALVQLVAPHVPPLFAVVHRPGGGAAVHFAPAGSADVEVGIAPHLAFTLWPFFLLWALAAVVFAASAWYLRARAARA